MFQTNIITQDTSAGEVADNAIAATTTQSAAPFSVETLTGKLHWVSRQQKKRFIVIESDDEKPGEDGVAPRRGITLNLAATVEFDMLFDQSLFLGDRVSVGIRVLRGTTLEAALASGIGIKGNASLVGLSITLE